MRDSATNDGSKYQDQTGVLKLAEFCKVEYEASMTCLGTGVTRDECAKFFMNYKTCKKRWNEARIEERKRLNDAAPLFPFLSSSSSPTSK